MQMKEILHPGVIKTSVMCVVGGRAFKKLGTTMFTALRKCHYSQIRRREGARLLKQLLDWIAAW